MFIHKYPLLLIVVLQLLTATEAMAATPKAIAPSVVVTIKPIHSLVAGVMDGISKPELLLKSAGSPHHYSLKPSDRRLISSAQIIFWVGPELEGFMPHLLKSLENVSAVSLISTPDLKLLPARSQHNNHVSNNSGNDAHIWLSTDNAHVMVDEINRRLAVIDPGHKKNYDHNTLVMHKKIDQLRIYLHSQFDNKHNAFIGYHDSYQYFEHEFDLFSAGFVSLSSAAQPGARHLQELRQTLKQDSVICAVYDTRKMPPIMEALIRNKKINTAVLDPLGTRLNAGKSLWFNLMRTIGNNLGQCLKPD